MLHIDTLTVSAFRGIPGEATIDLSAPLTLLYAPNGTGKTTVCDAVEWLLTRRVERIAGMKDEYLRCQHASNDRSTFAGAQITAGNRSIEILHELDNDKALVTDHTGKPRRCTPSEYYEYLAPHVATDFADARARLLRRREWIVGTYFLSSERLSRLMDSDETHRTRRQELFADLLGVGQLQRLAARFDGVLMAVDKEREEARRVVSLQSLRVAELETQLTRTGAVVDLAQSWADISQAAHTLGVTLPSTTQGNRVLDDNEAVRQAAQAVDVHSTRLEQQASAWRTLLEWIAYSESRQAVVLPSPADMEVLARQVTAAVSKLELDRQRSASLLATRKDLGERVAHLVGEIGILQEAVAPLHKYVATHPGAAKQLQGLLQQVLSEMPAAVTQRAAAVRKLKAELAQASIRVSRFNECGARLLALESELDLRGRCDAAREELHRCRSHEAELKQAWESFASVGQQIAELGREFGARHARTGRCPLCSHDWKSLEALKGAMAAASTALAPDGALAQRAYAEAREATVTADTRAQSAKAALDHRNSTVAELQSLNEQLQPFWKVCAQVGLKPGTLPELAVLDSMLAGYAAHEDAIAVGHSLWEVTGSDRDGTDSNSWSSEIEHAINNRESERADADTKRRRVEAEAESITVDLPKSEEACGELRARLAAAEQQIAAAKEMHSRRDAAAQIVNLPKSAGQTEIETGHAAWQARRQQFSELTLLLQAASNSLLAQTWRTQLESRKADAVAAAARDDASAKRCADVRVLQGLLLRELESAKKKRIDGLRVVIEALFLKMHAARIAEGVSSTADSSSFAIRIGKWLSEAEYLSQGQRQDLAIAIFLARARSYGGTFFLDEPLLHLDDLNRVALLDVLRAVAIQSDGRVRLVVTTASSIVLRHLQQKCRDVTTGSGAGILRAYELSGSVKDGVEAREHTAK